MWPASTIARNPSSLVSSNETASTDGHAQPGHAVDKHRSAHAFIVHDSCTRIQIVHCRAMARGHVPGGGGLYDTLGDTLRHQCTRQSATTPARPRGVSGVCGWRSAPAIFTDGAQAPRELGATGARSNRDARAGTGASMIMVVRQRCGLCKCRSRPAGFTRM